MKNYSKIIDNLHLIYFEYDPKTNTFLRDSNSNDEMVHGEVVRITYTLTNHKLSYYIAPDGSIVISLADGIIDKIKRYIAYKIQEYKVNKMNIYLLGDKEVKGAKNLPIFSIHFLSPKPNLKGYDGVIFTSKNGILGIDKLTKEWKNIPAYVIAPQSAKILKTLGGKLEFVSKARHGNPFALEIAKIAQGKKLLYISGKTVVSQIPQILNGKGIECDELIVYETLCTQFTEKPQLPKGSAIIFSSPSTIGCFLENNLWDESFFAIAIGKTTAEHFPPHITPILSESPSLDFCVRKAIEVLSTKNRN